MNRAGLSEVVNKYTEYLLVKFEFQINKNNILVFGT